MNQNLFILTFLLFLPNQHFVGSVDRYYLDCSVPARTCPDNQTIRFPFYLRDQQKSFCGYPGFEVSCDEDGHSILNLSVDDPYIVRQISYHNRSLIVSNPAISHNSTPNCIPPLQSMSFPNERFELPKQNHLLSNCYPPRVPEYEIGCSSENATNWVLGVPENDKQKLGNLSKQCGDGKVVVLPVKYYNRSDEIVGMRQVLSRGFELTWKADDCSRCQRTGGVCGFNVSSSLFHCYCKDRPHLVYCRVAGNGNKIFKATIATTVAAVGILTVIMICCIRNYKYNKPICFWKKQNQTDQNIEAFLSNYGPVQVRRYSYSDVKKMTNSFKEKLGQGGYGGVYKGRLHDESLVAVKVLKDSKGNGEEFINEVASISRTSHVNIVSLLGFCFEGRKRALIYQFMPNGSLEKFIFNSNHSLAWDTLSNFAWHCSRA